MSDTVLIPKNVEVNKTDMLLMFTVHTLQWRRKIIPDK